jgi:flagellar FliL protein
MATMTQPQPTAVAGDEQDGPARSKRRVILLAVVAVVVAGAAAFLLLGGRGGATKAPPPEPGAVLALDPINVNLADGHYLKVGLALQLTAQAPEEVNGAHALDITIDLLSGQRMGALLDTDTRNATKEQLLARIEKAYPEEVMDLYFTEFVMQ